MTEKEQERLLKLQSKISELKTREQTIITRDKQRQRKERTRRLIQIGALAEKYLNCPDMEPAEFEKLLKRLIVIDEVQKALTSPFHSLVHPS